MAHMHEKGSEFRAAFNKIYLDDKWQKKIACIGIDFWIYIYEGFWNANYDYFETAESEFNFHSSSRFLKFNL